MRVLFVTSEMYPLVKTGGLADVCGALPPALAAHGIDARCLIPGYPSVLGRLLQTRAVAELHDLFGGGGRLIQGQLENGTTVLAIDAPHLFDRPEILISGRIASTGRTTICVSRRWGGSAPIWRGATSTPGPRTRCTPTTGRRAWHLPTSPCGAAAARPPS
jgi:glycogen synthase